VTFAFHIAADRARTRTLCGVPVGLDREAVPGVDVESLEKGGRLMARLDTCPACLRAWREFAGWKVGQ
jgi:hypothetical protein